MFRHRIASTLGVVMLFASTLTLVSTAGATPSGAATSGPACTFNKSTLPIIPGVSSGKVIDLSCTGLPPLHPYLLAETSLLAGIDPKAKAALVRRHHLRLGAARRVVGAQRNQHGRTGLSRSPTSTGTSTTTGRFPAQSHWIPMPVARRRPKSSMQV